jgi:diguanylate cyclase (GGDEF)-like protein
MPRASLQQDESDDPRDTGRGHGRRNRQWLATLLVCALACSAAALLGAHAVARSDAQRGRLDFRSSSKQIASSVGTAIEHEEDLVIGASAFITEHPKISPSGFDQWARTVRAFARYPELQDLGLVQLVPSSQLHAFESQLAANPVLAIDGHTGQQPGTLSVLPPGPRAYYCFATAGLARNQATYLPAGLDYCALAPDLLPSRETGRASYAPFQTGASMTTLGVETPVYRGGIVPTTASARRAAFVGWLGELLTPSVVVAKAAQGYPDFRVELRYGSGSSTAAFSAGHAPAGGQRMTIHLGSDWSVLTSGPRVGASLFSELNSTLILVGGALLSTLLAALFFVLVTSRQRALALVEQKTRQLSHLALHDPLTGLPNRALVLDRARRMLARSRRTPTLHTGVLFIDIDGFKQINDEFGHAAGDEVLETVAGRLTASVRVQDTVGRLGGDEFVVLAESDGDPLGLSAIAARIIASLREPITLEDSTTLPLTASIGITSGQHESAESLLREADNALYRAKAEGKDRFAVHAPLV